MSYDYRARIDELESMVKEQAEQIRKYAARELKYCGIIENVRAVLRDELKIKSVAVRSPHPLLKDLNQRVKELDNE